ncbi:MAG: methyltransferase domain-containing protein [Hyphomonadaceae bacterium]|nr:methyltransferase domain-containing protein [Hyphomonadaceae bacterium]
MDANSPPLVFDRARHIAFRDRAAPHFGQYDFLKQRVSSEMIERLADSAHRFPKALDLGSHTGTLAWKLGDCAQVDTVTCFDASPAMAEATRQGGFEAVSAAGETLPFEEKSFDLVASALSLHWVNDLPGQLIQIRRMLKPDGLFLGAYFGAGTLAELRTCLMEAESELTGGASPRVSPLPGLQDSAALLQRAGFALPVADMDHVTVRYETPFKLLEDLRGMGEQAAFAAGGRPLSRRVLMRMAELYARDHMDSDGRVRASFEIIWLSGWAPAPGQPQPKRPGSATASLAKAVGSVEKSAGEKTGR